MGKLGVEAGIVVEEPHTTVSIPCCCKKSTWKWMLSVVLGLYVLATALWLIVFRGSSRNDSGATSTPIPYIEASFRLRRPITVINESLQQLQTDLQDEIGIPDTQIDIVSMVPVNSSNWTEVRFTVSPYRANDSIAPVEISLLKETFVELFMQRAVNLSLTDDVFGRVFHFEVLHFPGGITVVPDQPGFPLSRVVLFNFTLHDSLSHITCNFAEFKKQLASGIILKPNENLFVQLTNLEGSTLNPPLVIQTSILPVVGIMLPAPRLKQLAQQIMGSPSKNLGLNHTLFGRVKEVKLSTYLECSLEPAQSPSPSPSPAPSFVEWPQSPAPAPSPSRWGESRGQHVSHSPILPPSPLPYAHKARAPASGDSVTGWHHHHHYRAVSRLAPSSSASPAMSPRTPTSSYRPPLHSSYHGVPARPPLQSVSATPSYPGPLSGPLESHERLAFAPTVASTPSSAVILGAPTWGMAVLLVIIWIIC